MFSGSWASESAANFVLNEAKNVGDAVASARLFTKCRTKFAACSRLMTPVNKSNDSTLNQIVSMKQFNTLVMFLLAASISSLFGQTRYVDPIFSQVNVTSGVTYGTNISILTGQPASAALLMDVYRPVGDTETERPVVLYFHTGSFLPQYFNGQITGGRLDSTVVEICTRLAKRGYVAIAASYRQGWLPLAEDQNTRTATLLQAAYRGIQDARTLVRFLRKDVAEGGNTYGVDPDKIVMWGQGTGGYISLGAAFLDEYSEVVIDKFINSTTLQPYVIESLHGDVYGLVQTPLNIPNHVGYSSDFALAVNMGGALGDISWLDGSESEPAVIGYHVLRDPFAPFANGAVIVPTTGDFVVSVSGTYTVVDSANTLGNNDILASTNAGALPASFGTLSTVVNLRNDAYSATPLNYQGQNITVSVDNMYPFVTSNFQSGPWDWWSKPLLNAIIPAVNAAFGTTFSSDTLHNNGLLTNPDMSPAKARAYIDTVMAHFLPRACQGLQLSECALVNSEEIVNQDQVQLQIAPNPTAEQAMLSCNPLTPMEAIQVFDINGRYLQGYNNVNNHQFELKRGALPPGTYLIKVRFADGIAVHRVMFQ